MNDFIFTIRIHVRCTIHREQKNCNRYQNLKLIISTALYRMLYLFTSIYVDFLSYFYCIHLIYNNKNKVVVYLIKLQRRANGNLEFCMISFFTDFFSVLEVHDYAERRGGGLHTSLNKVLSLLCIMIKLNYFLHCLAWYMLSKIAF